MDRSVVSFPRVLDVAKLPTGDMALVQLSSRRFVLKFGDLLLVRLESTRALDSAVASGSLLAARHLFAGVSSRLAAASSMGLDPQDLEGAFLLDATSTLGFAEGRLGDLLTERIGDHRFEPDPGWIRFKLLRVVINRSASTANRFRQGRTSLKIFQGRTLYDLGGVLRYYHLRALRGECEFELDAVVERVSKAGLLRPGLDHAFALQILQARLLLSLRSADLPTTRPA